MLFLQGKKRSYFWLSLFLMMLLSACATIKDNRMLVHFKESSCNQLEEYNYSVDELPTPLYQLSLSPELTENFSWNSLNIANAIGVLDHLEAYIQAVHSLKSDSSIENRLKLVEGVQQIEQRLNYASVEISAVSAEIDCEEDRAEQLAAFLKNIEKDTETKLTVGAIVVGAVGAITTGVLIAKNTHGNAADYVGIGSGLIEAGLGLGILLNNKKIWFYHERNALKDVWMGVETSSIFPPAIWYYLNYYNPAEPTIKSPRHQIIRSWMSFEHIEEAKEKKKEKLIGLYFGEGGRYTVEQLENRSDMYDLLESVIKSMKQDLKNLMLEIKQLR